MTCVLALVQPGTEHAVTATAAALADLLGAIVRTEVIPDDGDLAASTDRAVALLDDPDVEAVAMSSTRPDRRLLWAVLARAGKPVVVVPDDGSGRPAPIARALVPLEATAESAAAIGATLDVLARGGVDIVVLHVLEPEQAPAFWDHPGHAAEAWTSEFLARYCRDRPEVRMTLRTGRAEESIADVARDEQVDLVALAWSRRVEPGRARIVRGTLPNVGVPVLLVPVR